MLAVAAAINVNLQGIDVEKVEDDDTHPFYDKKVPVITMHSLTQDSIRILHTSRDRLDAVQMNFYVDAYRLAAFCLAYLDRQLERRMALPYTRGQASRGWADV